MKHKREEKNNIEPKVNRFDDIINSYAPSLLRYLSSRIGDKDEAQDIAQEAYFRLSRVKDADLIRKPESYLFRIAVNLASELLLKNSRKAKIIDLEALQEINGDGDGDYFQRQLEAYSDTSKVEEILEKLPPLYKTVLLLRKRDGFTHMEIAEKLSISTHAVNRYLTGALQKCRKEWEE